MAWASAVLQYINNTFLIDSDNLIAKALPLLMDLLSFILQFTGSFFPKWLTIPSSGSKRVLKQGGGPCQAPAVIPRSLASVQCSQKRLYDLSIRSKLRGELCKAKLFISLFPLPFISSLNPQINSSVQLSLDIKSFQCKSVRGSGLISSKGGSSTFSFCS